MKSMLTVEETSELIRQGKTLLLAGDESLLSVLPTGRWAGGTIPYFMAEDGGCRSHELIGVTMLPEFVTLSAMKLYSVDTLSTIPADGMENGFSYIVIPAFTEAHQSYARECSTWPGIFDRPIIGWVAGVDVADLGRITPKVFHGLTGESSETDAIVMHLDLPASFYASLHIVNLFHQGDGDTITFPESSFEVNDCFVNGTRQSFATYLEANSIGVQNPLVADYLGAMINVCIQTVDRSSGKVALYAPVFPGVEYRLATPLIDYEAEFGQQCPADALHVGFSCNCILNYLYARLEGKKTGSMVGPITFGEIACMLLNQTLVYLTFDPVVET